MTTAPTTLKTNLAEYPVTMAIRAGSVRTYAQTTALWIRGVFQHE